MLGFLKRLVSRKEIDEWEIKIKLVEHDVELSLASEIAERIKRGEKLEEILFSILSSGGEFNFIEFVESSKKPCLILFLGFNGSGKTTTLAKVASILKNKGYSLVLAAGDTFRAGSIEQIEEHARNLGVKVIKYSYGADSCAVIYEARKYAERKNIDFVLADTAGRSHSNVNLIEELKKICRINKPELKVLVLDALTGSDIVNQAKYFDDAVGVDCLIFTKLDVYSKGGSILSAVNAIKKPVAFLCFGQEYDKIKEYKIKEVVDMLLK